MIEVGSDADPDSPQDSPKDGSRANKATIRKVFVAKVHAFLAIKGCKNNKSSLAFPAGCNDEVEICLIRYYDRIGPTSLDAIDHVLGCVKLKWSQRQSDEYDNSEITGENEIALDLAQIDVQDVSTIRGMLRIVRGDYGLHDTQTFSQFSRVRDNHWFYVNRLKQPARQNKYFKYDVPLPPSSW
jgi:hypothetical protein